VTACELKTLLRSRLDALEVRLGAACRRAGRPREDVTLVAVTKTVSPEVAGLVHELGVPDLGENRPQELWRKAAELPTSVRWHLIGHLQRNKLARTLPLAWMIHSVDSSRLLLALEEEAGKQQRPVTALLEVNAGRDPKKNGFRPEEAPELVPLLRELRRVRVVGLMTMAALEDDPERCRPTFVALRHLRDRLQGEVKAPHDLRHLSMGMSNDFEIAVEEGATLVRVGSALFADLPPGAP
jgi:pyridoxal phosphate enzyme (YggS family)